MTQDLTKITTPFGLLDAETQKALKECGGPWERYTSDGWMETDFPAFGRTAVYRQKPTPREYVAWAVINPDGSVFGVFEKESSAISWAFAGRSVVKLTGTCDEKQT